MSEEIGQIKLVTPGALKRSLTLLQPRIEAIADRRLSITLCPALAVPDRLTQDSFDLAVTGARAAAELASAGVLRRVRTLARSGVGAFVRRGDPKPDISTPEAFLQALHNASVITFSDPRLGGSASNYVAKLIERLDSTGTLQKKIKLAVEYRSIANIVAAGGVDLALNQVTEIMADPRLELVAPLPEAYQKYTEYAVGIVHSSKSTDAAAAIIDFLKTPEAVSVMRQNGFEP